MLYLNETKKLIIEIMSSTLKPFDEMEEFSVCSLQPETLHCDGSLFNSKEPGRHHVYKQHKGRQRMHKQRKGSLFHCFTFQKTYFVESHQVYIYSGDLYFYWLELYGIVWRKTLTAY